MSLNFRVGQRIACVRDGRYNFAREKVTPLKIGEVYRVRSVEFNGHMVRLEEIRATGDQDDLFWHDRFELVAENKTDTGMAILKSILEDAKNFKVKENADA